MPQWRPNKKDRSLYTSHQPGQIQIVMPICALPERVVMEVNDEVPMVVADALVADKSPSGVGSQVSLSHSGNFASLNPLAEF